MIRLDSPRELAARYCHLMQRNSAFVGEKSRNFDGEQIRLDKKSSASV
jgi:hypothetical protein